MPVRAFNAYIDETGDDGFRRVGERGRGVKDAASEWLIIGGVLIPKEEDNERTRAVDELRVLLNRAKTRTPLHWRNLRQSHTKKRLAMDFLGSQPLHFSIVAFWKPALKGRAEALERKKGYLYHYAGRFLIERLSWYAEADNRKLNLFFESRATTKYAELVAYVKAVEADSASSIKTGIIGRVEAVNSSRKGAQLADYYVGAAAEALEPDPNGYLEADYLLRARHQLFRRPPRSVLRDGFKIFPNEAADSRRFPWLHDL